MPSALIDSGALIARFAVDDEFHLHFDRLVTEISAAGGARFLITWPCVVEASYRLNAPHRFEMLSWIEQGGVTVYPFEANHLPSMIEWMKTYTEHGKREMQQASAGRGNVPQGVRRAGVHAPCLVLGMAGIAGSESWTPDRDPRDRSAARLPQSWRRRANRAVVCIRGGRSGRSRRRAPRASWRRGPR